MRLNRKRIHIAVLVQLFILFQMPMASAKPEQLNNDNTAGDQYSDPALRPEIIPQPQKKLPDAPEEVQPPTQTELRGSANEAGQAPKRLPDNEVPQPNKGLNFDGTAPVLEGNIDASAISGTAELMTINPLSRYRGDKLVFYKIHIKNGGATPVVVLGKNAQVTGTADSGKTAQANLLEQHDNTLLTPKEKAAVYAVGIGSAGLASILFYEHMTPTEHKHRNLGIALGRDRGRHEVEAENLGTRLLMPGDETLGWLAFDSTVATPERNSVGVPLMFPPYSTIAATLRIPVTGTTSVGLPSATDNSPKKKP
jgi:hypothetical protein